MTNTMTQKTFFGALLAALILLATGIAHAADGAEAAADSPEAQLSAHLATIMRGQKPDSVSESPIPGLYQVAYGTNVFYMTADGRYLVDGAMIDLTSRRNLTETARADGRLEAMKGVSAEEMIVFPAKDEKHVITVFTDIDCPYCQKLHDEVPQLNERGVTVQYLLFPRAGVGSASYNKAVSAWCADDARQALTDAKARKPIEDKTCDNPVRDHMALGDAVGVTGTPAIVLENGELIPGYRPAKELADALDLQAERQAAVR